MKFIEFHSEKCDECFKCLRACPTKAIAFTHEKRHIIDDLCIKCGQCLIHCTQEALTVHDDHHRIKTMLAGKRKVAVSLAPSFVGVFDLKEPQQIVTALKNLGFDYIEETAVGAEIVSNEYDKVMDAKGMKNVITSCCPSSMYLLQHNYGTVTNAAIPVVSPMIAHGLDLKQRYGDIKTVFIGPCMAKKAEAREFENSIDAVLTFKELEAWFIEDRMDLENLEPTAFDFESFKRGSAFPIGGSLLNEKTEYRNLHIEGIDSVKEFLTAVEHDQVSGFCAEINICTGGCLNGPEIPNQAPNIFTRISRIQDYVARKELMPKRSTQVVENINRVFEDQTQAIIKVDEAEVYNTLFEMGKYTEQDQINCGACGYTTCYEKAVAVVKGYSDIELCLERLKHKVESLQSIIFDNSPNAICILDDEQRIKEINPAFNNFFNKDKIKLEGWPINAVINSDIFDKLSHPEEVKISKKMYLESVDSTFFINLIKIHNGNTLVGIFTDMTYEVQNKAEMDEMKVKTLDTIQVVIEKQMRVAQDIASLLGETTAETKIGLNKLRDLVINEGDV